MITIKQIGTALKELLKEKNMSYQELSNRTGISKPYIAEIISTNRIPSRDKIEKIATAFEIDPFYFREYRLDILKEYLQENPHYLAVESKEELLDMLDYRKRLDEAQKKVHQDPQAYDAHNEIIYERDSAAYEEHKEFLERQNRIVDFIMEATGKIDVTKLNDEDMELVVKMLERLSKK